MKSPLTVQEKELMSHMTKDEQYIYKNLKIAEDRTINKLNKVIDILNSIFDNELVYLANARFHLEQKAREKKKK